MQKIDHKKVWGNGYHAGVRDAGGMTPQAPLNTTNAMLCWHPDGSQVKLFPWPDYEQRSREFPCTTFAVWTFARKLSFQQRKIFVVAEMLRLIVDYGCDPKAVHEALLDLQEYQDFLRESESFFPQCW